MGEVESLRKVVVQPTAALWKFFLREEREFRQHYWVNTRDLLLEAEWWELVLTPKWAFPSL